MQGNVEPVKSAADPDRLHRAQFVDRLQRLRLLERLVHEHGQRLPLCHRHRLRGRGDPLHDRRHRPDELEPALHRPVQRVGDDDGQVPRLGQRRQRRGDQEPADPDRLDGAQLLDRLQRLGLLELLVHERGQRLAVGERRRLGRGGDPLHDRRLRPDELRARSTPPRSRVRHDDGQVPRLGQRRQHRDDQEPADPGRLDAAQLVDRLQRRPLLQQCL